MKLYHSPTSPFVRKVMILLAETGQSAERIAATGTPIDPQTMPIDDNPLGKLPCLLTEQGALYDSRVITRYLDDRAGGRLYPTGAALWPVLTLEALADGMMEAAVLMRYETVTRPEAQRSAAWTEAQWAKVARALDACETRYRALLDAPLHMGQVGLACALGYLDFRLPERGWREGRPALAAWYVAFAQRPSFAETTPA